MNVKKDSPWIMRTYSGHSSPKASNELYKQNLAKGQTGLSVAFDLPTQTGYDSDHVLARGEVGRTGVPICHIGDMRTLFEGISLEAMNTSMTINATAAWLLSLYIAVAEEQGADTRKLRGTTQNDIIKEYLSRGTYIFPPEPSMRLIADTVQYTVENVPEWNPTNICSYHLQEAGATPEQEVAYALSTAIAVLDTVRARGIAGAVLTDTFSRLSFFVNSSIRFVDEVCKQRAFGRLWEKLGRERYGITDEKALRFRYGVQVNSLGLTEAQPENNIVRIVLEMLGVTLSKKARARAIQLPAWNEALGLPRPWDQQLSLRSQQILAYETDLLEFGDILDGSPVIEARVKAIADAAWAEVEAVLSRGGIVPAVEYVKERLVASHAARIAGIERGDQIVVGVNKFTETAPSPLQTEGGADAILRVDPAAEKEQIARLVAWRQGRDAGAVERALAALREAAKTGQNIMPASIAAAKAGVTTGEWGGLLREVFGEYRAPTGVAGARSVAGDPKALDALREKVVALQKTLGRRPKLLVGKPGLDGHSNGAEQIALRARDAGFEVVYEGIRVTPQQLARAAADEGVHLVGLSILSGAHLDLVREVLEQMKKRGLSGIPVVAGGIIPETDADELRKAGVRAVYTPKDFQISRILGELVDYVREAHAA
ncbi:MAG TPA: protein meaA [Polyangiaceae bacterium]|nr:protein meaA [Polyangiaceae bacterium]